MIATVRRYSLYCAWVIALLGFCLSVFYGEVLQNVPCPLCWYQRIALFPLAILLGLAVYRDDPGIIPYAMTLALLGGATALFQVFEGYFPVLQKAGVCRLSGDCSQAGFAILGNINFPALSAIGFLLISGFLILSRKKV